MEKLMYDAAAVQMFHAFLAGGRIIPEIFLDWYKDDSIWINIYNNVKAYINMSQDKYIGLLFYACYLLRCFIKKKAGKFSQPKSINLMLIRNITTLWLFLLS